MGVTAVAVGACIVGLALILPGVFGLFLLGRRAGVVGPEHPQYKRLVQHIADGMLLLVGAALVIATHRVTQILDELTWGAVLLIGAAAFALSRWVPNSRRADS